MQELPGPRKVLILEDDSRTMSSLTTAAARTERIEVVWARTLEEAIDALEIYFDELDFIVLADSITDGTTVDFAHYVQQTGYQGLKIRTTTHPWIDRELQNAGFEHHCHKFELPAYLSLLDYSDLHHWDSPPTSPN